MAKTGIIGGTGLSALTGLERANTHSVETLYGLPSCELVQGKVGNQEVVFLARHGNPHRIPPHMVNYRANISALKKMGVTRIIAVNAVGGIHPDMGPTEVVIPDQIIDYTYDRIQTFFEENLETVHHIDFTYPFSDSLRNVLLEAAQSKLVKVAAGGTYGCTQGPRLETAAEIQKLKRDGCDLVGMTMMPEAALARELNLDYASVCVVVNWGAGLSNSLITMEDIEEALSSGMQKVISILHGTMERLT